MKKISIIVPCFNEEKSVHIMHEKITNMFHKELKDFDYELIFVDDYSMDNTRNELEKICILDKKVKAIFNAKNFGFNRNVFYSLMQGSGDAVFLVFGDLQDPPELLLEFVEKWREGYKVILGQKIKSKENKFVYLLRTLFYKMMDNMSQVKQIQHFNGFGLYDKDFIDVIKSIDDSQPYLKGIVGEFGMKQSIINYNQEKSARGKSNFNFFKYYDVVMLAVTSYTKILMRIATFIGGFVGIISLVIAIIIFINKILNWNTYPIGVAALTVGVFFIGAVQLFFIGILGEYILSINTRTLKRPLVVAEKKINFEDGDAKIEEYNS
ncbi:glycosyltransferase family 2 protein [Clostridioides sp. ZZV14-6045]|uniref:glycosyltransferase family 2 protein n=1 Tax=Clostridioides sp. ZZV14-6045 TaxID=2811489 RepID=UPI001D0FD67C|nr:glycosyltransferase family 2 protein [Clostridioides sp. ZZV14-6045]